MNVGSDRVAGSPTPRVGPQLDRLLAWQRGPVPEASSASGAVRFGDPHRAALLATGLVAFVVYLFTMERHVAAWDVAEFQTVPHVFGISHPTGYPLFTILGGLWSQLPIGGVALRMNLLSALLFASAGASVAALCMKLRVRPGVAAVAGLIFCFTSGTWKTANHVDVQSLHTLLLGSFLAVWVMARQSPTRRNFSLLCALAGLGVVHHALMILTAVPLLAAYAISHMRLVLHRRTLLTAIPSLGLPLCAFFYLPLRAGSAPVYNAIAPQTMWETMQGVGFRGRVLQRGSVAGWRNAVDYQFDLLRHWMGLPILLLALAGVGVLLRRDARGAIGLAAVALIASYTQANSLDSPGYRYLISVVLVVAALVGVVADSLIDLAVRTSAASWRTSTALLGVLAFLLLPLNLVRANFRSLDRSGETAYETNGMNVLNALPPRCVIWSYWDVRTTLLYLHHVEGVRPDVTVLDARSIPLVGGGPVAVDLFESLEKDPSMAGRPVCYIPQPGTASVERPGIEVTTITQTLTPWGLDQLAPGWVYLVSRVPQP